MIAESEGPVARDSWLAATVGESLAQLAERVRPGVVMVRDGRHGAGSGIIWRADGIIMTNHHVVARRDTATVLLADDRELRATVIARDPVLDLAALRVDAIGLPVAEVGDSERVRVGELVLASGNPWGQRGIVTAGIISGVGEIDVSWRRAKAEYLRSDVQLAPGNSGGPLLDARGSVIGVNAMIFGGDLSVAIPSHVATQFLLVAEGRRPVLGVGVHPLELPPVWQAASAQERGLLVTEVRRGSAAARAGLYPGDVLLDVAGRVVADPHALAYTLARQPHGARVDVRYLRGGAIRSEAIALDDAPQEAAA
jgi:serine protease Do